MLFSFHLCELIFVSFILDALRTKLASHSSENTQTTSAMSDLVKKSETQARIIAKYKGQDDEYSRQIQTLESEIAELKKKLSESEDILAAVSKNVVSKENMIVKVGHDSLLSDKDEGTDASSTYPINSEAAQLFIKEKTELSAIIKTHEETISTLEQDLKAAQESRLDLQKAVEGHQADLGDFETTIDSLNSELEGHLSQNGDVDLANSLSGSTNNGVKQLANRIRSLLMLHEDYLRSKADIESKSITETSSAPAHEAQKKVSQLESTINELNEEIERQRAQNAKINADSNDIKIKNEAAVMLQQQLEDMRAQVLRLTEQLEQSTKQNHTSEARMLKQEKDFDTMVEASRTKRLSYYNDLHAVLKELEVLTEDIGSIVETKESSDEHSLEKVESSETTPVPEVKHNVRLAQRLQLILAKLNAIKAKETESIIDYANEARKAEMTASLADGESLSKTEKDMVGKKELENLQQELASVRLEREDWIAANEEYRQVNEQLEARIVEATQKVEELEKKCADLKSEIGNDHISRPKFIFTLLSN